MFNNMQIHFNQNLGNLTPFFSQIKKSEASQLYIVPNQFQIKFQHINVDIQSLHIQYTLSLLVIISCCCYLIYQLSYKELYLNVFEQGIVESIYDIYDKIIIFMAHKVLVFNLICLLLFGEINSPSLCIVRVGLFLSIYIVFIKLYTEKMIIPIWIAIKLTIILSAQQLYFESSLPLGKICTILTVVIFAIAAHQTFQITKLLKTQEKTQFYFFNTENNKNQGLLSFAYNSRASNRIALCSFQKLDPNIILHLKNRRAYCVSLGTAMILSIICIWEIQAFRQFVGQIFVGIIVDLGVVYSILYNLKREKNTKQKIKELEIKFQENRRSSQRSSNSHIVIEMVQLEKS